MIRRALFFTAAGKVEVREEQLPDPGPGQVVVETHLSAISAGSELLIYRGQAPGDTEVDPTIPALAGGRLGFPLKYGYSAMGRVSLLGPGVGKSWQSRPVFAFQPHQSHFVARIADLFPLPDGVSPEEALFLPNVESAVGLIMDGRPMIGERAVVLGQGVVGLLTTALLSRFPLEGLRSLDVHAHRRKLSRELGADESLDPNDPGVSARLAEVWSGAGADLVYELSGNPEALNLSLEVCGSGGRIVIGSWYGRKRATLDLGGKFHRGRIRISSSQVSTLAPELTGRWSKARRLETAWRCLREIGPARFITRRFPLEEAGEAYRLLDRDPSQEIQVVLTY